MTTPIAARRAPGRFELIALLASLMALMGFATDAILPAMTDLAAQFAPDNKSKTQLVVSLFMLGAGLGMVFFGPLSDSIGRRPTLTIGISIYIAAAAVAVFATSLEMLLICRFVQGLGASTARMTSQAVTRDMFSGADQARIASLTFMVFVMVPAMSPFLGQQIIHVSGWQGVFVAYMALGCVVVTWFLVRQPETLAPAHRRPFKARSIWGGFVEVARTPVAVRYILVQSVAFGQFTAILSSAEQLWVDAIGVGKYFPLCFAGVSVASASAGFVNARLVQRVGMRRMLLWAFGSQVVIAPLFFMLWLTGIPDGLPVWGTAIIFGLWCGSLFFMNGLVLGNIVALAMEPLGHIAGTAAAVAGAVSTSLGMFIGTPLGMAFDGTPRPIMLGAALCSACGWLLVRGDMKRSRV